MLRKTLIACALATCGLSSAHAMSVEVYGLVDYGFSLSNTSGNAENAIHNDWNFEMKSGILMLTGQAATQRGFRQ